MKRRLVVALILGFLATAGEPASAYLKLGTSSGSGTVTLSWHELPVRYFITNQSGGGVNANELRDAIGRAFSSWHTVETAETSSEFAGFTSARPNDDDGLTVIGFENRPDQDRTLGATSFLVDLISGEIVEAEIFFNSAFDWSVASAGQTNRFDLESIAVHEIGHLLGLGHSALGETELRAGGRSVLAAEAVMFPIAFSAGTTEGRTLRADDKAGVSDIYPNTAFKRELGSVSGQITKNGAGVLGAHVVAFNLRTGRMVSGFSMNEQGRYVIAGLEAGPHVLRVEPLDDGDVESFFDLTLDIDTNFRVKFYDRVVVVPRGGGTNNADIRVEPK